MNPGPLEHYVLQQLEHARQSADKDVLLPTLVTVLENICQNLARELDELKRG